MARGNPLIMKGKFITLEGIDGAGKSTVSRALYKTLQSKRKDVILTQEPTRTWRGRMVTRAVEEGCHPVTLALAFMADRSEHVLQIKKWLDEGNLVLCDRYVDSTLAYQVPQLRDYIKNPLQWLLRVHEPFYLRPDITFLFVIEPTLAMDRITRKLTAFENIPFLEKVQGEYVSLAKENKRYVILDATKSVTDLVRECLDAITVLPVDKLDTQRE